MDLGIKGKVAMVAAGTKGIGLAIAKGLAEEGCLVSVCARDASNFPTVLKVLGPDARAFECDVTDAASLEKWFADTGAPDILITNTGGPPAGSWTEMTDEQWHIGVDSTLLNVVRMVRIATPLMAAKKWGRIIHITSLVAKEPNPLLPISSTLRSGLMALTRLQATELAPHGITVNGVLPGHTLTDRQIHLAQIKADRDGITVDEALANQAKLVPMGRLASPAEIAAPTVFLCGKSASYVTGINLLVDGGMVRGLA
jgi:3-oxoacyl-[acyl-carrier protein] reductase